MYFLEKEYTGNLGHHEKTKSTHYRHRGKFLGQWCRPILTGSEKKISPDWGKTYRNNKHRIPNGQAKKRKSLKHIIVKRLNT